MSTQASPRITIITPSLNQADYLERAVCSVLDQGYENLEYIVIDGGSNDSSAEIIRLYEDDLAYWQSEADGGPADAINQAIQRATGDIIAVLNADDLYLPGTLDRVARQMSREDAPAWAVGHCMRVGELDEQLGELNATKPIGLAGFLMHDSGYLPTSATFYRRGVFDSYGQFDPQMQFAWNYELNCRLIAQGLTPAIIPAVLSAHREHAHSKSAQNTLLSGAEYIDAAARYADRLPFDQRHTLWNNIDERRRIYALAQSETLASRSRGYLWRQLLRRPWWLANDHYRQTLLRGITHPANATAGRVDAPARRAA
jgi:glycosyltransferase involved in cell wall biosynthesis